MCSWTCSLRSAALSIALRFEHAILLELPAALDTAAICGSIYCAAWIDRGAVQYSAAGVRRDTAGRTAIGIRVVSALPLRGHGHVLLEFQQKRRTPFCRAVSYCSDTSKHDTTAVPAFISMHAISVSLLFLFHFRTTKYTAPAMNIYANPAARRVALPFCLEAVKIVKEAGYLENPESPFFCNLVPLKPKGLSGTYANVDENCKVDKIGSTSNLELRLQYYKDSDDLPVELFRVLIEYDSVSTEVDGKLQVVYDKFLNAMIDPESGLHPCQRDLFHAIRNRGGERLGLKKQIFLQLLEGWTTGEVGNLRSTRNAHV